MPFVQSVPFSLSHGLHRLPTGRRQDRRNSSLHGLVTSGIVALAAMTDAEYEIFHELTSTSPSLDDGEAATIAIAEARHFLPVIDGRRGRRRASALMKTRTPGWSLDLFHHPTAIAVLGDQLVIEALYLALRDGRIRIPSESVDNVIALIGMERSHDCTCLPGYRDRFVRANNRSSEVRTIAIANLEMNE